MSLDSSSHSSRRVFLLSTTLVLLLLGGAWAYLHEGWGRSSIESLRGPFDPATWIHPSESQWVLEQTVRDVTEMLCVAAGERPEAYQVQVRQMAPRRFSVRVEGPKVGAGLIQEMEVESFLWDPATYATFVHALSSALQVQGAAAPSELPAEALQGLLTPTPLEVERIQRGVSEALNHAPNDARLHEAAAAVLAAFALYHEAGAYTDHRAQLNRLSAHLALAAELRSGAEGPAGAMARVALLVLTGQTKRATEALEALKAGPEVLPTAWANSLFMRATGDWRGAEKPDRPTLAELLAACENWSEGRSEEKVLDLIEAASGDPAPEFLYHTAIRWRPGVELGHRVTGSLLELDQAHLRKVQEARGVRLSGNSKAWDESMNTLPGRAYNPATRRLEVVDWGAWAQRFQAELLQSVEERAVFLMDSFGSTRDGQAFLIQSATRYGNLRQFPVLQVRCARFSPQDYEGAITRVALLLRAHPEAVSDSNFVCMSMSKAEGTPPASLPRYGQWLSVPEPPGTAYNLTYRCWEMAEWNHLDYAGLQPYRQLRPQDPWLMKILLKKRIGSGRPSPEAVEEIYGPVKAFAPRLYLSWMKSAYPPEAPEHLRILAQLAELRPSEFLVLGRLLVHQGREAEALEAYLRGFRDCQDRVRASNSMRWAVARLYRAGRTEEAEHIAVECGAVYSAEGLETLALLRELQGRYAEVEKIRTQRAERYGALDGSDDFGTFMRCAEKDPAMKRRLEVETRRRFPEGIQTFDPATAPLPPATGIRLARVPEWAQALGFDSGAIIVAIDGHRVENQAQYLALRAVGLDEELNLVVFQKGRYQTLKLSVPGRRFGVELLDYRKR